jgi:hypothetical protein
MRWRSRHLPLGGYKHDSPDDQHARPTRGTPERAIYTKHGVSGLDDCAPTRTVQHASTNNLHASHMPLYSHNTKTPHHPKHNNAYSALSSQPKQQREEQRQVQEDMTGEAFIPDM